MKTLCCALLSLCLGEGHGPVLKLDIGYPVEKLAIGVTEEVVATLDSRDFETRLLNAATTSRPEIRGSRVTPQ